MLFAIATVFALGANSAGAAVPANQGTAQAGSKISAEMRSKLSANPNSRMRYLVVMAEQANTENDIIDWNAKGRYVLDTLRKVANATQPKVADFLSGQQKAGSVDKFKSYYIINAFAVWGNLSSAEAVAALPEVARIDEFPVAQLDEMQASPSNYSPEAIEWNVAYIRAPQAWAMGYDGNGVSVGSLDTGARWTHNAIKSKYRGWNGTTADHNYNWWDPVRGTPVPYDNHGHGTHTIGTIVGDDGAGNQIGVAPGAKWIASNGIDDFATDPDIIEAGEFMLAPWDLNHNNPDPARRPVVVSNSWGYGGSSFSCAGQTFFRTIVQNWSAAGILPSFSAGNAGTAGNRIPAAYPETYENGSITSGWTISSFSSRGPSCFDGGQHPQTVTGGSNVRSADAANDTGYVLMSGTSMAQPAVAGSVAILKQANPNLTIQQTWFILTSTAAMTPGWGTRPNSTYGWGIVQLDAAVQMAIGMGGTATPTVTGTPPTATNTPTQTNSPTVTNTPGGAYTVCATATASPIPTGTTDIGNDGDDVVTTVTLPFPYSLYGMSYTSVNVSSNGNAQFNGTETDWTNDCLPSTAIPGPAIFPYWEDQMTSTQTGCASHPNGDCGIYTATRGTAQLLPPRKEAARPAEDVVGIELGLERGVRAFLEPSLARRDDGADERLQVGHQLVGRRGHDAGPALRGLQDLQRAHQFRELVCRRLPRLDAARPHRRRRRGLQRSSRNIGGNLIAAHGRIDSFTPARRWWFAAWPAARQGWRCLRWRRTRAVSCRRFRRTGRRHGAGRRLSIRSPRTPGFLNCRLRSAFDNGAGCRCTRAACCRAATIRGRVPPDGR
jgi:subtilisin family serine protease